MEIGSCWAIAGATGKLSVTFATRIVVDSITVDHIPERVASDFSSAPHEFHILVRAWVSAVMAAECALTLLSHVVWCVDVDVLAGAGQRQRARDSRRCAVRQLLVRARQHTVADVQAHVSERTFRSGCILSISRASSLILRGLRLILRSCWCRLCVCMCVVSPESTLACGGCHARDHFEPRPPRVHVSVPLASARHARVAASLASRTRDATVNRCLRSVAFHCPRTA